MFFKVIHGFDNQDFIRIDETELEKAMYAHLTGKVAILGGSTIRGSNIISIKPDMGFLPGYEMQPEDFIELKAKEREFRRFSDHIGKKVSYLIAEKKENLIGTGFEIQSNQKLLENKIL